MAPNANVRQVVPGTEQVLPTWLTYSPIVGPSGTSYTILRLPLTYYGPSIPLGTDGTWTYGGLSSPPPSATASVTPTSTPPPTTTVPPTTTFSSTTLPTSTSLSSTSTRPTTTTFASVSVITRTRTSSTAPTGTSTAAPGGSSLPPVAIALIALGAAAAVLLCCLVGALLWRRRKSRREREPLRGDSEFYAGPPPDEDIESIHAVPNLMGERHSLLGNDSFIVVPGSARSPQMTQRSFNGVSYQRLGESRAPSHHSSRRTGSDEIGVAYTDMPPPRSRRRTVTVVSNAVSSSPSHPTSSSRPGIGSMRSRNESQRSSLFERPAEQDESPVLPRESTNGMIRRASDLANRPLQAPAPTAQPSGFQYAQGATLGTELGILGLGTRYPDPSQSLLATSSSGGSFPPRLVVPTPSSLGSRSRVGQDPSRPPSQFVTGSQAGSRTSRASRGHSPAPSIPPSPPPRDTLTWPESPESEHDESAQLLTAERGNVRSGIGLLGRFSWFTRGGNSSGNSPAARTSRNSYPGWMSPPTEEGFLAEADEAGPSASDPPTLESKPPMSHPGMVRLVPREQPDPSAPRPVSSVSGNTVYHDAPSQPATPRTPVSTWLGFLGRASPASGPAPPVPQRPSPLSTSTPALVPSTSVTPPLPARTRGSSDSEIDPASRLPGAQVNPPTRPHSDILDAPAPESLLDVASPTLVPPSPAPVFPPGLTRLPRTWNFGLLNELGDEPPAAEERWAHIRSTPSLSWDLRRFSLGRTVQVSSPHTVTSSQVASVHGGGTASPTTTDPRQGDDSSRSHGSQIRLVGSSSGHTRPSDSELRRTAADQDQPTGTTRHSVSMSGTGTSADNTTVSSHHPSTLMMTESGRFGFDFGGYGYVDSEYDDYETRATTISGDSSGREAVDLHGEDMERGQDVYVREGGRFLPPMSAVGISNWGQHVDAESHA